LQSVVTQYVLTFLWIFRSPGALSPHPGGQKPFVWTASCLDYFGQTSTSQICSLNWAQAHTTEQ
jgi:hypothetical protein